VRLRVRNKLGVDVQRERELDEIRRDITDVVEKLDRLIEREEAEQS